MKGTRLASEVKYLLDYAKWMEEENRIETWDDTVDRVMGMHRQNPKFEKLFKNKRFEELFNLTNSLYRQKVILGSNRAFQFGGAPILKHNSKMFNCLTSNCDRPAFFQEACYWLLSGCGVGFSVQKHHIEQLPPIYELGNETKVFVIPDSIEGWSDAFGVLLSSYFDFGGTFTEFQGKRVVFDYTQIREEGSFISGGFKAPGPDGLRKALEKCRELLDEHVQNSNRITPIIAYDFVMHMSDAVLSGGVRRSSTICLFSLSDEEMMEAKNFKNFNPLAGINRQRARSNNSVVLHRKDCTKEEFMKVFKTIQQMGEPGFYFVDDYNQGTNPCVEIGMWAYTEDGKSGWQGCNLTTQNGKKLHTLERFLEACIGSAVLGTLQCTYTDFRYVGKETKEIFDKEALLGCSITGWMNNPEVLLNEDNMKRGAELIKEINKELVDIMRECGIDINYAARTTCVKPEGNSSVLLECESGVHGAHSKNYFRVMQVNKNTEVAQLLAKNYPEMTEECSWSANGTDYVFYFPITPPTKSKFKRELLGVKQLEVVKQIQQHWVMNGKNEEACVKPFLSHNVSNTTTVVDWDEVAEYVWENRKTFSGISFLPYIGDKLYYQAPFTEVLMEDEIVEKYGSGGILASGLVVDGLHVFDNLWETCNLLLNPDTKILGKRTEVILKEDWVRRARQFARRYFKNDIERMTFCLKDVHLFHKWCTINRVLEYREIDFSEANLKPNYVDANTLGAISCAGGECELPEGYLESIK